MTNRNAILRLAALVLLLYSLFSLGREYRLLCQTQALADALAESRAALAAEAQALAERLEQPPDEREMRRLAWERLGMVAPGEKIFYFTQEEADRENTLWDLKLEALWKAG